MMSANRQLRTLLALRALITLALVLFGYAIPDDVFAQADWPQWRGTQRDGQANAQRLLKSWNAHPPQLAWSVDKAGMGFSSVSVVGDALYTMGKREDKNVVICLGVRDGVERWATPISDAAQGQEYMTGWGSGPRGAPTVDGDRVYALCDLGTVACLDAKTGRLIWSVHLVTDLEGSVPKWGYSESVLVDGDRLVVTPGGKNFMVALNKESGAPIWRSKFSDGAQYVSVVKHQFYGISVYVSASAKGLVGIDVESGETAFVNAATGNSVAVIPTPLIVGNSIYHTSAYQAGNALVDISLDAGKLVAKQRYHEAKESMENHHGGVVYHEGTIFGFSKALRGVWMAQDFATGRVLWSKKIGKATSGSIAMADGLLYCYDDQDGVCYLIKPSRTSWESLGQVTLPKMTSFDRGRGAIWTHPIIADHKLFIRDQEQLFAWDLKERSVKSDP
jgi:outer membrane protein assembly factor BamB